MNYWKDANDKKIWSQTNRKRCVVCGLLTHKWHRINGGPAHCFDDCYSTTGIKGEQRSMKSVGSTESS